MRFLRLKSGETPAVPVKRMNLRKKEKFDIVAMAKSHEMVAYAAILAAAALFSGAALFVNNQEAVRKAELGLDASALTPLSYQVRETSRGALSGSDVAFDGLAALNAQILGASGKLGDPEINKAARLLDRSIGDVVSGKKGIVTLHGVIKSASETMGDASIILKDLSGDRNSAAMRINALKLMGSMQEVNNIVSEAAESEQFVGKMAQANLELEEAFALAESLANLVREEDGPKIERLNELLESIATNVDSLTIQSAIAKKSILSSGEIESQTVALESAVAEYEKRLLSDSFSIPLQAAAASGLLFALVFIVFVVRYISLGKSKLLETQQQNKENQDAIMMLMDDLQAISDGDLTQKTRVTESITGSVADSINYTIDEVRNLVKRISDAAGNIRTTTESTAGMTNELSSVASEQAREIENATSMVGMVVKSIQDIDESAAKSADVARRALFATEKGGSAVADSVEGMNKIRDQIQDTSKRIKRLGESSQEIGNIIALISGITEQTRVLALNAALQAVQAGDAGRGFAIVAEEVQHLAERSANATTQIAGLVRIIQNDTHDAVAAMEKSTEGVVQGGKLNDEVNNALGEIKQVAHELAGNIESITVSTQMQSDMSRDVTEEMGKLMKVVKKSGAGVTIVSRAVADISNLAETLEGSVKRFKI